MRKITLLKDHESPDGIFKAGETIEVSPTDYDFLMSVYIKERKEQVSLELAAKEKIDRIARVFGDD